MRWHEDKPAMSKPDRLDWLCWFFVRTIYEGTETTGDGPPRQFTRSQILTTLDRDFVDAYLEDTNMPFLPMMMGAHRCNALARDLRTLADEGVLRRAILGNGGMGPGWPKWCRSYSLQYNRIDEARRRSEHFKARHP